MIPTRPNQRRPHPLPTLQPLLLLLLPLLPTRPALLRPENPAGNAAKDNAVGR
jgi:hypothetical protein